MGKIQFIHVCDTVMVNYEVDLPIPFSVETEVVFLFDLHVRGGHVQEITTKKGRLREREREEEREREREKREEERGEIDVLKINF